MSDDEGEYCESYSSEGSGSGYDYETEEDFSDDESLDDRNQRQNEGDGSIEGSGLDSLSPTGQAELYNNPWSE
jgi:hypothetical protein